MSVDSRDWLYPATLQVIQIYLDEYNERINH